MTIKILRTGEFVLFVLNVSTEKETPLDCHVPHNAANIDAMQQLKEALRQTKGLPRALPRK
jgi:hypothetical protein